jgi:methyl-accepting chemotaxis protein
MLNRMAIGRRLGLGFGMVVLVFVGAMGIVLFGFRSIRKGVDLMTKQTDQLVMAKDAHAGALATMTYIGAATTTRTPETRQRYLEQIGTGRSAYVDNLNALKQSTTTAASKAALEKVEAAVSSARADNTKVLDLVKAGKTEEAGLMYADVSIPKLALWNQAFGELDVRRRARLDESVGEIRKEISEETVVMVVAGVVAILASAVLGALLTRSITVPVKGFMQVLEAVAEGDLTVQAKVDSRDEIGHLAESLNQAIQRLRETLREVTGASQSVASGATELSASADQMSATTQEIARGGELLHAATDSVASAVVQFLASVEQVAANVQVSARHTEESVAAADAGTQGSRKLAAGMARIREATAKINTAVGVIREIAQQTNLLSLNAAIEAAKAGDQGKGFAVVADEVRKLAERSRQATVEIAALIQDTDGVVAEGVASAEATAELIGRIHDAIGNVSGRVLEIGAATQEQSGTAGEIAKRMEDSAREVGQNAAATHQLSATVQEISRTAAELAHISDTMALATAKFRT